MEKPSVYKTETLTYVDGIYMICNQSGKFRDVRIPVTISGRDVGAKPTSLF